MIISYHSIHFSWVFLTPSIENHGTQPWENPGLSYGILPSDNCGILILNHTVMVYTTWCYHMEVSVSSWGYPWFIIHFEGWDFPQEKPSSELGLSPWRAGTPHMNPLILGWSEWESLVLPPTDGRGSWISVRGLEGCELQIHGISSDLMGYFCQKRLGIHCISLGFHGNFTFEHIPKTVNMVPRNSWFC